MNYHPNLFIVGAAKSGTSSLWYYLKNHPDVFMPKDELEKEPGFFSDLYQGNNRRLSYPDYLKIFKSASGNERYMGEASTVYLTDPAGSRKIHDYNPDSKIIIILRNPVDRAYSLYNWMVQEGYEYASDFEKALEMEKTRKEKQIPNFWEPEYFWSYMYFGSGLYYDQVKRYTRLFKSNTGIFKFDWLVKNPGKFYQEICRFLDIGEYDSEPKTVNKSKRVVFPLFQFLLRKLNPAYFNLHNIVLNAHGHYKKKDRDALLKTGLRAGKPRAMSESTKMALKRKYAGDIRKLISLTRIDFSDWIEK